MDWKSDSISELASSLALAQPKIKAAAKDKANKGLENRKYATLGSTWDAVREALNEHGLSVVQLPVMVEKPVTVQTAGGEVVESKIGMAVDTVLIHRSGEWLRSRTMLDYQANERAIKPMQALGSAITYARRYGLAAMLGVCSEDDDGESSGGTRPAPRREPRGQPQPSRKADGPPPAKGPGVGKYVDRWHAFHPIKDGTETSERKRILVDVLIDDAVKTGRLKAEAVMTDGKPDRKKAIFEASGLLRDSPEYVDKVFDGFLTQAEAEMKRGA